MARAEPRGEHSGVATLAVQIALPGAKANGVPNEPGGSEGGRLAALI